MRMIDLHCDTLWRLFRADGLWGHRGNLLENSFGVDVKRLEKADALIQGFAVFFLTGVFSAVPAGRMGVPDSEETDSRLSPLKTADPGTSAADPRIRGCGVLYPQSLCGKSPHVGRRGFRWGPA